MRILSSLAIFALVAAGLAVPGYAAPPATGGTFSVQVTTLSPMVALIAGILILLVPRLLNYIVAIYLIISFSLDCSGWWAAELCYNFRETVGESVACGRGSWHPEPNAAS